MARGDGAWLVTTVIASYEEARSMTSLGRIKRIILGGVLGGILAASYLLGAGAIHNAAATSHIPSRPLAGGCPGVGGPC
jgi:hypothetical protein